MLDYSSISTKSLVLIYRLFQQISSKCSLYLIENTDKETAEYIEQTVKLESTKKQLEAIKAELDKRKNSLKVSEEELYLTAGQKVTYIMINFFPHSTAFEKYGESVHGIIWYHKKERERLEDLTGKLGYGRTNAQVYLSSGIDDKAIKEKVQYEGFMSGDISELYLTGNPAKTYKQPGIKEIPNTITVKIDSRTFDVVASQLYVLGHYINDGYDLPEHDLVLYYSNL